MKTKLFIAGLALMAFTTFVSAQNSGARQCQKNNVNNKGLTYTDTNKNGVCDNFENRNSNRPGCKGNGKGKGCARVTKQGQGCGKNFVDANKNGVCDIYEKSIKK